MTPIGASLMWPQEKKNSYPRSAGDVRGDSGKKLRIRLYSKKIESITGYQLSQNSREKSSPKMSLQWTLIASFLYVEVFVVLLLVLPVASPKRWQNLFRSRFLQSLRNQASMYFLVLLAILVLFLLDAIREMRKYSTVEAGDHQHLNLEMQGNMRLFRAQRNFYISGFALFLSLVIRRLVILISAQAQLLAQSEAALRQAQSATTTAKSLISQRSAGESAQNDTNEAHDKVASDLKNRIKELESKNKELESELTKEKKDKEAVKSQANSLVKEYDRLNEEHAKLVKSSTSDKKSD